MTWTKLEEGRGKASTYRLMDAHLSKTAKGAAASAVVVPAKVGQPPAGSRHGYL